MATSLSAAPTGAVQMQALGIYERTCASTRAYVAGIRPEQWRNACPSEGTVRGLVNHLVAGQLGTVAMLHGGAPEEHPDADYLGDGPLRAYDAACVQALAAWREPGALERLVD